MQERQRARRAPPPPAPARRPLIPIRGGPEALLSPGPAPALRRPAVAPPDAAEAATPPAPESEVAAGAEAAMTDAEATAVAPAEPAAMEVALLIPPPPPDLESRTLGGARRASRAMGGAGSATQALPPADANTAAARANVQEPAEETTARAQGALTAALREQPAPSPEIEQLCDDIQDAIENRRPPDEDSLRRTDPEAEAQAVGDALNDDITDESQGVATDYNAVNAPAAGAAAQNSAPLPNTPATVATPNVNAGAATPPAVPAADVDMAPDVAATQASVEDAGMTTEPAQLITSGPVADARAGMGELEQAAAVAPGEVLRQQDEAIAASREAALQVESQALAALERSRSGTVQDTFAAQLAMAGSEEEQRVAAAAAAETIFTTAQTAVNELLTPMVSTAMSMWNTGKEKIAGAFDTELKEAKRLVDERHEGVGGAIVSIWDSATGLPDYITDIYTRAERTFGRDICTLIREVSTYVNGIVIACEELIDNADRDIAALFEQLPASLQGWATEQQAGFQGRLDGLRDNVHDTQQNFTNDLVGQAGDAVQEARERIDALREAAKGLIQKVADAVNAFIDDPVRAIINGLLMLVGIAPAAFWALIARIEQVASDIADDPQTFATNLLAALRLGFDKFFGNFFSHLLTGFINWLFSAMKTVGVQLPADTSLKSIITFFLQLMGLTWPNIRKILVKYVGERNVALLEKAYELLSVLISEGPGGIFELIKEKLDPNQIFNTIVEAAVHYMVETIAKQVATRILLLFNPVGAIAQAIEAIFRVLKWVFENAARIFQLVETIVNGMADLIAGNIEGMAKKTEQALAGMLVPVIDFIAGYLGMGDLPDKIAEVVGGFQQMVLAAVERAIAFMVDKAKALLEKLGLGGKKEEGGTGDTEVGEQMRFSAAGESHRLWIDTAGTGVTVMVASNTEKLEDRVRRWNTEVGKLTDETKRGRANSLLPQVNSQLGITTQEAEESETALAKVKAGTATPEETQAAEAADAEAEAAEAQLVPMLKELFEIFGEALDLSIFDPDLNRMSTKAIPDARSELNDKKDTYLMQSNWAGVKGLMIAAGQVEPLHRQPLGTSASKPFQAENYATIFRTALDEALQVVMAQKDKTEERLLQKKSRDEYANNRRPVIHGSASFPEAEEGSRAAQQATLRELQSLLFRGGNIGPAKTNAVTYFKKSLEGFSTHSDYTPQNIEVKILGGALVISYDYGDEAEQKGGPRDFSSSLSLSLISTGLVTQYTFGTNLALKVPGTRGYTVSSGQLSEGSEAAGINLESAHVLADQFMGSGYRQALNLIVTSSHYNQVVMAAAEGSIREQITAKQLANADKIVTFNLKVTAFWKPLPDDPVMTALRNVLPSATATLTEEDKQKLGEATLKVLQGKQDPRIVQLVQYRGIVYANGISIGLVQADTNPPVDEEYSKVV